MKRPKSKNMTKKNLKDFLLNEEGKIMKKNIATLGISLAALLMMFKESSALVAPLETEGGGGGAGSPWPDIYVPPGGECPELYQHNSTLGTTAHASQYIAASPGGHSSQNTSHSSYCHYVGGAPIPHNSGGGGTTTPNPGDVPPGPPTMQTT